MNTKDKLLWAGMGCFLIAAGISFANLLIFPYARQYHGFAFFPEMLAFAVALGLLIWAGHAFEHMENVRVEKAARILRPAFLAALLIVHLLMGYWMEYTPSGDNLMLYNGAQMLAQDGSFERNPDFGLYLARFSNQWGFLLILTGIFKLFFALGIPHPFFLLAAIQAGLYVLGMRSALRIAKRLYGERGECLMILMLAACLPLWLAAAVLYTDTFSLPFILMALDFAMRAQEEEKGSRQFGYAAICGALVLLGSQIKMTTLIVLIAACIIWVLTMKPGRACASVLVCAAMMAAGTGIVHHVMLEDVLNPAEYEQQHTPAIHWVMMSIPTSDNPYGSVTGDYGITWGMMESGASHDEVMASIYSRMRDRIYTLRYPNRFLQAALRKNANYIGDGTFGMTEMLDDGPVRENAVSSIVLEGRKYYPLYQAVSSGIFMAQLLLSAFGCWTAMKKHDFRTVLPAVSAFGVMLFLMFWEARSRYIFGFVPVILLLAVGGVLREENRNV